jgi:hypothetical protein
VIAGGFAVRDLCKARWLMPNGITPLGAGSVNVSATGSAKAKLGDSWYSIAAFNPRVSVEGRWKSHRLLLGRLR